MLEFIYIVVVLVGVYWYLMEFVVLEFIYI